MTLYLCQLWVEKNSATSIILLFQDDTPTVNFSVASFQKVSFFSPWSFLSYILLSFPCLTPKDLYIVASSTSGKIKVTKKWNKINNDRRNWRRQNDKCKETSMRSHSLAIAQQSITETRVEGFRITSSNSTTLKQDSAGLSAFPASSAGAIVKREVKYLCNSIRSAANQRCSKTDLCKELNTEIKSA